MIDINEHYRRLERMYEGAPASLHFGPRLTISEGRAELRMTVGEAFFHAAGAMHGACYFKALDDATYFAAASTVTDCFLLTAHFEIDLLAPVRGGELLCRAKLSGCDERRIHATGELFDDQGRLVARGRGEFARSKKGLTPEVGYL